RLLFSGGRPRQVDFDAAFDRAKRRKQHEEDEEEHDDVDHGQHLDARLPVADPATRLKSHRGLPPLVIRSVSSSARRLISRTLRSIWLLNQWWIAIVGIAMIKPAAVVISASAIP